MKRAEWTSDSLVQQDSKLVIIIDQKTTKYHNESIRPGIIIPSILLPCFLCPHGRLFSNRTRILYHSAKIPGQNYSPSHRFSFRTSLPFAEIQMGTSLHIRLLIKSAGGLGYEVALAHGMGDRGTLNYISKLEKDPFTRLHTSKGSPAYPTPKSLIGTQIWQHGRQALQ